MVKRDRVKRRGTTLTQIRVVEGYRPGPRMNVKHRTIKNFGYLEDQEDPESFLAMVEEFNKTFKEDTPLRIEVASNARMYSKGNRSLNYGYKFLESVFNMLKIDLFIEDFLVTQKFRGEYSPKDIFKFLVILRILRPDSKRATFQLKNNFYNMNTEFDLQDIYRSLTVFTKFEIEIQRFLNERIKETIGRDLSYAFYDVTNYFFEIDFPDSEDDLRAKGVSKEHRTDPIVAMGLFMDSNGIPVNMSIFPGNTSDSITLEPTMNDVKKSYGLGRLIVVADKGLNSSKNIDIIVNNQDGFIFSQVLKEKKGKRYNDKLFDKSGWISNVVGTYKYKIFIEEYAGKDKDGKKVIRKRKVLLYWSKAQADMEKQKRDDKLEKAKRYVKNNAYGIAKGVDEYTKEEIVNMETGEILEKTKKIRSVNLEKAEKDALYDGYSCIITSELEYSEGDMRKAYHGLWKIEESFRILKSDLYARPVFVHINEQIQGHFLICFVVLIIVRIIQYRMGEKAISAERIARALLTANCKVLKGGIMSLDDVGGAIAFKKTRNKKGELVDTLAYSDEDEIALDYKAIQEVFGTDFYNIYPRQEEFNKFLKNISL